MRGVSDSMHVNDTDVLAQMPCTPLARTAQDLELAENEWYARPGLAQCKASRVEFANSLN